MNYSWNGVAWVPVNVVAPLPSAQTRHSGYVQRQLSPDGRFWWDGRQWHQYRRVTWNSVQLHSNPPEDEAILARNLGIWCIVFGTISLLLGGISILAVIGGIASLVHWVGFRSSNARAGGALPGSAEATVGLVLTLIGLAELVGSLALRVALTR